MAALAFALAGSLGTAAAAPKPRPHAGVYDLDILGFNDGAPYRLSGAAAEAVLAESGAVVFRFQSKDWLDRSPEGRHVPVGDIVSRYPARSPEELIQVFRVDLDLDRVPEMLLVAEAATLADGHRYAPTVLGLGTKAGYAPVYVAEKLPGERHRVVDIRDLNGDGRPEVLLAGEAGSSGYYQYHELVGRGEGGYSTLPVRHVDSIHFLDLDRDRRIEVVIRERVGRKGPAYQWTYVDKLLHWDGKGFVPADDRFPRYHDEETLPTLVGDLIDHYQAAPAILEEKVEAILAVRGEVLEKTKKPAAWASKVIPALQALEKDEIEEAEKLLSSLDGRYPYDVQVLVGRARVHAAREQWAEVLDLGIRALTVDPRSRRAWWWVGVAFSQLEERSSAIASFHDLVRLTGPREEGLAFLRARRGEPGMEGSLQRAIDGTLESLGKD